MCEPYIGVVVVAVIGYGIEWLVLPDPQLVYVITHHLRRLVRPTHTNTLQCQKPSDTLRSGFVLFHL